MVVPDESPDDLLTTTAVAELFKMHRNSVRYWASSGRLASVKTPGGRLRFKRADVEALYADTFGARPETAA